MVLVTVGMNEQPFDRLARLGAALARTYDVCVQHGSSAVRSGPSGRWVDFLGFDELEALMRSADAVVAHAGVGTIMLARRCGRLPVLVPRRHGLGEAVDDHQVVLAERLADGHGALVAHDEAGVRAALVLAQAHRATLPGTAVLPPPALATAVLGELRTLLAR